MLILNLEEIIISHNKDKMEKCLHPYCHRLIKYSYRLKEKSKTKRIIVEIYKMHEDTINNRKIPINQETISYNKASSLVNNFSIKYDMLKIKI